MTLEGQGEAFTFNWIDRSSTEVARPPPAGNLVSSRCHWHPSFSDLCLLPLHAFSSCKGWVNWLSSRVL